MQIWLSLPHIDKLLLGIRFCLFVGILKADFIISLAFIVLKIFYDALWFTKSYLVSTV